MAKADPRLGLSEAQQRGAAGVKGRTKRKRVYKRKATATERRRVEESRAVVHDAEIARRRRIPTVTSAKTPRPPKLTREQELEMAVEIAMAREPAFEESARRTRMTPFARHYVFGPAMSDPGFDPSDPWEWLDPLVFLPFGRPIAGVRAGVRGVAALRGGARTAKEAAKAEYRGPGITRRAARKLTPKFARVSPKTEATQRALENVRGRRRESAFRLAQEQEGQAKLDLFFGGPAGAVREGLERELGIIGEPAARSLIGKGIENIIDRNRDKLARTKVFRDRVSKAGERFGEEERFMRQYRMFPAVKLKNAAKKLRAADMVALRIIGEGTSPERRLEFHLEKAAELSQRGESPIFHTLQAELVQKASRYIDMTSGRPQIAADAPRRLRGVDRLLQDNAEARESIYRELGVLSEEAIENRIQAPGAAISGARWVEDEVWARHKLLNSPKRAELSEFLVDAGMREGEVDAFMRAVADPSARAHVDITVGKLEKLLDNALKDPDADPLQILAIREGIKQTEDQVDLVYQRLQELVYGQPGDFRETVTSLMEAAGPRATIISSKAHPLAERAFESLRKNGGFTLKPNLGEADLKKGYMVALGGYETKIPIYKMNAAAIEDYRDSHHHVLKKGHYVGGWFNENDNFIYLDISRRISDVDEAIVFAREQGQLAIWDNSAAARQAWDEAEIPTGLTADEADKIKNVLRDETGIRYNAQRARETTYPERARLDTEATSLGSRSLGPPAALEEGGDFARGFIQGIPSEPGTFRLGLAPYAADITTAVHEWGHFLRAANVTTGRLQRLGRWAGYDFNSIPNFATEAEWVAWHTTPDGQAWRAAEEKIAEAFTVYVMGGGGKGLSLEARSNMEVLVRHLEEAYHQRDLMSGVPRAVEAQAHRQITYGTAGLHQPWDELPPEIKDVFDFWLTHEELRGGRFRFPLETGAPADYVPAGRLRVPYERGLPVSVWKPWKLARAYVNMRRTASLPGHRGAMGAGSIDPTLNHAFKAALLKSGMFKADVTSASVRDLQKASNLMSIAELRKAMLATDRDGNPVMAKLVPERADDIAVKIDPRKTAAPELKVVHDLLRDAEGNLTKISRRDVEKQDWEIFETLAKSVFPDEIDGQKTKMIAQAMIEEGLDPIDNIVWVPRRFLDRTQLFDPPQAVQKSNALLNFGRVTADVVNDFLKTSLLYLNPAYYGMNFSGNLVMNLMHEGVFMPLNLSRAFWISHQMGEETAFIDFLMGRGLMSVADLRSLDRIAGGAKVSSAMSYLAGALVDMIPRRAAFIHEARRAGYRNADQIRDLLNHPEEMYKVVTKAKQAMVDFDNLSQFEREVLSRYIFVYPWLKGSTSWTVRFPREHPIQTAALMWAYERQQSLADEHVGERPTYLDLILPIGVADRYGEQYPVIMQMRQIFTASTTYEIARNVEMFVTGNPNGQALSEMLQPWYGALVTSITGYDPFRGQPVERGLPTLAGFLSPEEWPGVQSIDKLVRSEEERQQDAELGRLYPRNRLDDLIRVGFGSVAPTPVNPETARKYAQIGPKSPEEKLTDWVEEQRTVMGEEPDPYFVEVKANKIRYSEVLSEMRREKKTRDLSDRDLIEARMRVYFEANPEEESKREEWLGYLEETPDDRLNRWNNYLENALGWPRLNEYERRVRKTAEAVGG